METLLYLGPEGDNLDQKFNMFTYLYLCLFSLKNNTFVWKATCLDVY